jgi:hypothetical protein
MHVNLPISLRADLINKGSKIIFASPVDGNIAKQAKVGI